MFILVQRFANNCTKSLAFFLYLTIAAVSCLYGTFVLFLPFVLLQPAPHST